MKHPFITDKTYKGIDYSLNKLPKGEYENCTFDSCSFSRSDLTNISFMECTFMGCDLSNAQFKNTSIKETVFENCKMLGLRFDHCNPFLLSFKFKGCTLNLSSFYKVKLKNSTFNDCKLIEVDFTDADATAVRFHHCNLEKAIFENTILEKADFRSAYGYSFDPEKNSIKKARFSKEGIIGLLAKYDLVIES